MALLREQPFGPQKFIGFLNGSHNDNQLPPLGYNYPIELQHMVQQHYLSFTQPKTGYYLFFHVLYVALMVMSLFGNGLVLYIFTTSKNLRTPSNLLIINLAVFDMVMLTNMPHYLIHAVYGYVINDLSCDFYAMLGGISGMGGSISNAFIAYDRYRTISNPIDGRLSYKQILGLILFSWLYTIPFSALPFFQVFGRYIPEGYLTVCSFDYLTPTEEIRNFVACIFVWAYCIPMSIIVMNYYRLFGHVREHEKMLADQAKKMNVKSLSANSNAAAMKVEIRIAKVALTIYFLFCLSWTPYAAVALLSISGHRHLITPFIAMLPSTTAKAVSCIDPWVYAASHPKYRLELERRLPWLGIREKSDTISVVSETGTSSVNDTVVGVDH